MIIKKTFIALQQFVITYKAKLLNLINNIILITNQLLKTWKNKFTAMMKHIKLH